MEVTIRFYLSDVGRKASILNGGNGESSQSLALSREDEEFARALALAEFREGKLSVESSSSCKNNYEPNFRSWDFVPTATQILDDLEGRKQAFIDKEETAKVLVRTKTLAVLKERKTRKVGKPVPGHGIVDILEPDYPYNIDPEVTNSPEALAWVAELNAANAVKEEVYIASSIAKKQVEAEAKAATIAAEKARRESLGLRDGDLDLEFEHGALTNVPIWGTHNRCKNWMAVIDIDPTKPGGLNRVFVEKAHGESYYVMPFLENGDAVEFGADYYTSSGRKNADRWYGYVVRIDPESDGKPGRLVLHTCTSGKEACKSAKKNTS